RVNRAEKDYYHAGCHNSRHVRPRFSSALRFVSSKTRNARQKNGYPPGLKICLILLKTSQKGKTIPPDLPATPCSTVSVQSGKDEEDKLIRHQGRKESKGCFCSPGRDSEQDRGWSFGKTGGDGMMGEMGKGENQTIATLWVEKPGREPPVRGQVMDRLREFLD